MEKNKDKLTHFGYSQIPRSEKSERVAAVFNSVAARYDLMNDLMSLGTHRIMKMMAANATKAREGDTILDLAGGTGDLTKLLSDYVGLSGHVYLCDINGSMLKEGRDRLLNLGISKNVSYLQADGEHLPFPTDFFDSVIIGFYVILLPKRPPFPRFTNVLNQEEESLFWNFPNQKTNCFAKPTTAFLVSGRKSAKLSPAMPQATATWLNQSRCTQTKGLSRRCWRQQDSAQSVIKIS